MIKLVETAFRRSHQDGNLMTEDDKPERKNMNLYGIQSRSTIDSWNTTMARDNAIERDNLLRGYERVAISTVIGYMDVGYMVLCPYSGLYGEGYVVCTNNRNPYTGNASSRFMDIEYWIKKED